MHGRCSDCQAPIIWTLGQGGRFTPVDAEPVHIQRGFRLNGDPTPRATFITTPAAGELLHLSHYCTCPNRPRRPPIKLLEEIAPE